VPVADQVLDDRRVVQDRDTTAVGEDREGKTLPTGRRRGARHGVGTQVREDLVGGAVRLAKEVLAEALLVRFYLLEMREVLGALARGVPVGGIEQVNEHLPVEAGLAGLRFRAGGVCPVEDASPDPVAARRSRELRLAGGWTGHGEKRTDKATQRRRQ